MKFGVIVDEKGEERPLTQSSCSSFLVKRDRELRKRAFHQFYAEFEDHKFTLAVDAFQFGEGRCLPRARAELLRRRCEAALFYGRRAGERSTTT